MMLRIEVPEITACAEQGCAYNIDGGCQAKAITIGDGKIADCDTYFDVDVHVRNQHRSGVGACKVSKCRHNDDLECHAPAIEVGQHDCLTFDPR
jgi:hypothetical protein